MASWREHPDIDFVTFGMFILDDIEPSPSDPDQSKQTNVIGGAGTYSAVGARIFSPAPLAHTVGWIVDAGIDFPQHLRDIINQWDTSILWRERPAPTTRGWNGYGANEFRAFKYLTEKKRLTPDDLTPELLRARSFHLICSPTRCISMVKELRERRGNYAPRPIMIWEPVPDLCTPEELDNTLEALQYVDVISPNHEELASLCSFSHPESVDKDAVEEQANRLLSHGIGDGGGAVVVRVGKEGCYVLGKTVSGWVPAYHTESKRVVDPTGGGNGFLGGFAVGIVRSDGDVMEAALYGNVAASYCIEQVGVPNLHKDDSGETWNADRPAHRLEKMRRRLI